MTVSAGHVAGVRDLSVPSPTPPTESSSTTATPPPAHVWKSVSHQHRKSSRAVRVCSILNHRPHQQVP